MVVSRTPAALPVIPAVTSHKDESFGTYRYDFASALETTVVSEYRLALKKLEGLLYAVCGAMPKSYASGQQWWLSDNPRCLWPEQSFIDRQSSVGDGDGFGEWWWQVAAVGEYGLRSRGSSEHVASTGYFDWSRSDAVLAQYSRTRHLAEFFPGGAVTRAASADEYDDPTSAATVTITYTPPAAVAARVSSVTLYYKIDTGSVVSAAMTSADSGVTYTATIAAQDHYAVVQYYVRVVTNDETPLTIYDPYGSASDSAPTMPGIPDDTAGETLPPGNGHHDQVAGSSYYYRVFDHAAPYQYGLPELIWEDYTGEKSASLKRCTGTWRFNQLSDITVDQINVARFALDWIGAHFNHSPRMRSDGWAECCFDRPIVFRWSGSQRPWLYQGGGKGGTDDVRPLTNRPGEETGGSHAARTTWRGVGGLDADVQSIYARPWAYGAHQSWLSWPIYAWYVAADPADTLWGDGAFPTSGEDNGLWPGDAIDIVHLQEVIAAVDYLITNGLWWPVEVPMCKRSCTDHPEYTSQSRFSDPTFDTFFGLRFDKSYNENTSTETDSCTGGCAFQDSRAGCGWYDEEDVWHAWDEPTQAECRAGCEPEDEFSHVEAGACAWFLSWATTQGLYLSGLDTYDAYTGVAQLINGTPGITADACSAVWGATCTYEEEYGETPAHWTGFAAGSSAGMCYYTCPPEPYVDGPGQQLHANSEPMWSQPDELHGNGLAKFRFLTGSALEFENPQANQETPSMGNCAGDVVACGNDFVNGYNWIDIGFATAVKGIEWHGPAPNWATPSANYFADPLSLPCQAGVSTSHVPVPSGISALETIEPPDVDHPTWWRKPTCTAYEYDVDGTKYSNVTCEINFDGESLNRCGCVVGDPHSHVWFEVDLNVDGNGVPQLYDYELDITGLDDEGAAITPTIYPDTVTDTEDDIIWTEGGCACPKGTYPTLAPLA